MKILIIATALLSCALASPLLGSEKCTWGPSYWCSHVRHAKECGAMDHCMTTVWKNQIIKHQPSETCTFCQLLVNEVRQLLQNKATQTEVTQYFSRSCNILPSSSMQTECKDLVNNYMPEVLQLVDSELNAAVICSVFGLCISESLEDKMSHPAVSAQVEKVTQPNTTCKDCKQFMKDIQAQVTSNETVNEIKQLFIQTVCHSLEYLEPLCQQVVEEYTPMFLNYLASEVDPDIVCRMLGMCSQNLESAFNLRLKLKDVLTHFLKKSLGGSEECDVCKVLVQDLQNEDRDQLVQAKVKALFENDVCTMLGSLSDSCKQIVEEYAPMLFMLLANELDPDTVCTFIGFCRNTTVKQVMEAEVLTQAKPIVTTKIQSEPVKTDILCPFCHLVMVELDQMLEDNSTKEEIESAVEGVCARLTTADLQKDCDSLVKMYGDKIIDFLAKELNPSKVCVFIKVCSSQRLEVAVGSDLICELCTDIISAVEKDFKGKTEAAVMTDLEKLCALAGQTYQTTCVNYLKKYGPYVVNMLIMQTEPKLICNLAKACPSTQNSPANAIIKPVQVLPIIPIPEDGKDVGSSSLECDACDTMVNLLEGFVKDMSEKQIMEELEKVCSVIPVTSYRESCVTDVTTYGPVIIDLLKQGGSSRTICSLIKLCQGGKTTSELTVDPFMKPVQVLPVVSQTVSASLECILCELVMKELDQLLSKNSSEKEIVEALDKVCSILPSTVSSECKNFVKTYAPVIIQLLLQEMSPAQICTNIKLCSSKSVINSPAGKVSTSAVTCEVCTLAMNYLAGILKQNATEQEIEQALDSLCALLPGTVATDCENFVQEYGPKIIQLLLAEVQPGEICKQLGLCPAVRIQPRLNVSSFKPTKKVSADPECDLCNKVMMAFQDYISANSTEAQIRAALESICNVLPDTVSQECKNFVDQYADQIITMIKQFSPDQICQQLGLCGAEPVVRLPPSGKAQLKTGPLCIVCEFAMKKLDSMLGQNATEQEIKAALDKVCSLLPSTISTECNQFVQMYEHEVINLLIEELDPSKICAALNLCNAGMWTPLRAVVKLLPAEKVGTGVGDIKCDTCKVAIKFVDDQLKENRTVQAAIKLFDQVCSLLPSKYSQECKDLVKEYAPAIAELLALEVEPDTICKDIGLCSASVKKTSNLTQPKGQEANKLYFKPRVGTHHLLGEKECTYGPSFWCASKENAIKCKAVEHCKVHVWKFN